MKIFEDFQTFSIYHPLGIKLLNRLRVDFSHLNEHNFLRHRRRSAAKYIGVSLIKLELLKLAQLHT